MLRFHQSGTIITIAIVIITTGPARRQQHWHHSDPGRKGAGQFHMRRSTHPEMATKRALGHYCLQTNHFTCLLARYCSQFDARFNPCASERIGPGFPGRYDRNLAQSCPCERRDWENVCLFLCQHNKPDCSKATAARKHRRAIGLYLGIDTR